MRKLLLLAALLFTACGGGTAPELYNFVIDFFKLPDSCYAPTQAPSMTTTAGPSRLIQGSVWDGVTGEAFLELDPGFHESMGTAPQLEIRGVLHGTKGANGWTFATETTRELVVTGTDTRTVETARASMTFERGATFKGTLSLTSSRTCTGSQCFSTGSCPSSQCGNVTCAVNAIAVSGTRLQVQYQKNP